MSEARVVLYEKIGPGEHSCHWCSRVVVWMIGQRGHKAGALIADHVDADFLNDDPANLVPACGTCNSVRTRAVLDDEPFVIRTNGTRLRGEWRTCFCGAPFVAAKDPRPGRGLYCSRSCARRAPRKSQP